MNSLQDLSISIYSGRNKKDVLKGREIMELRREVLENGIVLIHEKRDVPVTTIMLAVKYGSAYEEEKEKGIAHYIEHLCFKGTNKRTAQEIAYEIESVGGDLNAFTSEEVTAYHAKVPSVHFEKASEIIFDVFFNASFPEEEFEKEGRVICEEIKMYQDDARSHVLDKIKEDLYEKPFGMSIAGTEEIVKSISREDLVKKHRSVYSAPNSIICVVGNNSFEEVKKVVEKFTIEREANFEGIRKIEKRQNSTLEKRRDIVQANIAIGFHFPSSNEEDSYASEVFCSILGHGMSSRLFREVREKRGLVYGVRSEIDSGKDYGYMVIWAGMSSENEEEVKRVCLEEIKKMEDVSSEELKYAKKMLIGTRMVGMESSSRTALGLILEEVKGNAMEYLDYSKKIEEVSLEEVRKFSKLKDYSYVSVGPVVG